MAARERTGHRGGVPARSGGSGLHAKVVVDDGSSARPSASRDNAVPAPSDVSVLGEIMRCISSTLEYAGALAELTRLLADRLEWGCVIDVFESGGRLQLAQVPPGVRPVTDAGLTPLIEEIVARGERIVAVERATFGGSETSAIADRARRKLGATWLVCEPIVAPPMITLGTLTVFGTSDHDVPTALTREIGRQIAFAIANGRLYRAALATVREREQILALVAHELKNPLGVIQMSTARATMAGAGEEPPDWPHHELGLIFRSASRMKRLVSDLLDLASIDAGRLAMAPTACATASLVQDAIRDVAPAAIALDVMILQDVATDLPAAWVDGDRIGQVLINLMTNAIKFTPRGGWIRVRATRAGDEVVIAIDDDGSGLAPADLERIFDRFWQAPDSAKLGTGLGLGICRSIVELSGGHIWAQSAVGVGTTLFFSMPTVV